MRTHIGLALLMAAGCGAGPGRAAGGSCEVTEDCAEGLICHSGAAGEQDAWEEGVTYGWCDRPENLSEPMGDQDEPVESSENLSDPIGD